MANIKSSKKAIKVIAKKTLANHDYSARVKNSIKECENAIAAKEVDAATEALNKVQKNIDKALFILFLTFTSFNLTYHLIYKNYLSKLTNEEIITHIINSTKNNKTSNKLL